MSPTKLTSSVFGISNEVLGDSYVDRGALDDELYKFMQRPTHLALRGESKCGKSWLRKKSIPNALVVQCRLDRGVHDIYVDALSQLGVKLVLNDTESGKITGHVEAEGSIGEGLIAKALGTEMSVKVNVEGERATETNSEPVGHDVSDLRFVADLIKASDRRLVIEDFHYLSMEERKKLAFNLKALWDYGLFVVIIGVWSQNNILIFLNPDLSGRIEEIPIFWSPEDLKKVLTKGGTSLNLDFTKGFMDECIGNCYGNVGILQSLVLRALDEMKINEAKPQTTAIDDLDALNTAAIHYADQLNALYQQFAKRVSKGIRSRQDSTGIYSHAMAVVLEASDDLAINGMSLDYIFQAAHAREPRVQKGNLRTILERFEELQVDDQGRGLVIAYNEADGEITVVDRQLLLYRKYSTVKWPWEDLIREAGSKTE